MRYINPEMKITMFGVEKLKTTEGNTNMDVVLSENYNAATKSLETQFNTAAGSAANILVFKWE
ncbi:MAG: hypothetical protein ACI4EA_05955 [Candidatus Ornithomonoglobus sp.]